MSNMRARVDRRTAANDHERSIDDRAAADGDIAHDHHHIPQDMALDVHVAKHAAHLADGVSALERVVLTDPDDWPRIEELLVGQRQADGAQNRRPRDGELMSLSNAGRRRGRVKSPVLGTEWHAHEECKQGGKGRTNTGTFHEVAAPSRPSRS